MARSDALGVVSDFEGAHCFAVKNGPASCSGLELVQAHLLAGAYGYVHAPRVCVCVCACAGVCFQEVHGHTPDTPAMIVSM